ncbi:hypothetical protein [Streptomyces sp. enrichment culture]|uniref:hypothetical protein n=1 Tax=Streptomyces sp. enrichment culture TaxID=1795815 RepID=UPI003F552887
MAACYLDRVSCKDPYCRAHLNRLRRARTKPVFEEALWRRTDKAICTTREVSLRGLPDRLVAEVLYGLWARVQQGYKTRPECLRPLYDRLRAHQHRTLETVTDPAGAGFSREQVMMIRAAQTALRRLNTTPEAERLKDVWDMTVFGHPGSLPFTSIVQEPLREAVKVWVYDGLPRRRNKNAVHHMRAVISAVALLSESLCLQRQDRGMVPAERGRGDIVAFSNRLGHMTATGTLSARRRLAFTRFVRRVLARFHALGLTGPGQLLEGMSADFSIRPEDMPDEPEDTEAGRDLPEEVLRQMCAHLDELEAMRNVETRVAVELLIDTGRRPDEVLTLGYDCLQQDPDGSFVTLDAGEHVTRPVPFDKAKIFPYAYRHCYAQRHADASVALDVLKELMDHRLITTTQGYYRVGAERHREAVDRVTALQFDRHGQRVWRTAKSLLDSEHVRRAIGEVATAYGVRREPSTVAAGGHGCPLRFRCLGCEHFSTDVSYLPDLEAHLADLFRSRERLMSAFEADHWARTQAMPSEEEIRRVRRLIHVKSDLDDLTPEERTQIEQAVSLVRRSRTVLLGMPRAGQPLPDVRPPRTAP